MFIRSPKDLEKAIEIAKNGSETDKKEAIDSIGTYKWYNFYCNIHIPQGSADDIQNEITFEKLEKEAPDLHLLVEKKVDLYIERLKHDIDY